MIKNYTNFALIAGIGLSLFSESSPPVLTTMGHEDSHMGDDSGKKGSGGDDSEKKRSYYNWLLWTKANARTSTTSEQALAEITLKGIGAVAVTIAGLWAAEFFNFFHTDTDYEKNTKSHYKYKLKLAECLRKHTSAGSTTEIPPACKELLHQFQTVATPEQVAAALQCLKPVPQ